MSVKRLSGLRLQCVNCPWKIAMNINSSTYSIADILGMLERRELVVNGDYQRGSGLWPDGPSSYFIDTILEGFPFPKIYLYEYLSRAGGRGLKKEIVDGQQRLRTITRFSKNEFSIGGDSRHAGKRFDDLTDEEQDQFLTYPVAVDVIRGASKAEILQMFRRMNAYTLPLNEAEKRHSSFEGNFKWFVNSLSDSFNEFFVGFGVFTDRQIIRMADAELITDCVLALERGVISTSPADLRELYKRYETSFDKVDDYRSQLAETIGFISHELDALRGTHMMKPYALHSLITALVHSRWGIASVGEAFQVNSLGAFAQNKTQAIERLLELARAHEAKETEGPYVKYVWGCAQGTNRVNRRTARVAAILRALGSDVPAIVDDNLA